MLDNILLQKILSVYINDEENLKSIVNRIFQETPTLGKEVYVPVKYSRYDPWQVCTCKITSMRLGKHDKKTFSVEGYYNSCNYNRYYQGNFNTNSINQSVFFTKSAAQNKCQVLNTKEE